MVGVCRSRLRGGPPGACGTWFRKCRRIGHRPELRQGGPARMSFPQLSGPERLGGSLSLSGLLLLSVAIDIPCAEIHIPPPPFLTRHPLLLVVSCPVTQ